MKFRSLFLISLSALLLACASFVSAGQWHATGSLVCTDCHVEHGTENRQDIPGGPFSYLLKKSTINELCLSCHDGTDPTAPDVLTPVSMYSSTSSGEGSAGAFNQIGISTGGGHQLGTTVLAPLQSGGTATELTCASCHAVHGNGNYRNLLEDPVNDGSNYEVVQGRDVFTLHNPDVPPTASGSTAAYERNNVGYVANYSQWCTSCHNLIRSNGSSTPPAHFNGHPSDVPIDNNAPQSHSDPAHWAAGSGEGFTGVTDGSGIPRVPFMSPHAADFAASRTPQASNQVFCLSCHKAHAGPNAKGLQWPYSEGGATFIGGCQQCHNK